MEASATSILLVTPVWNDSKRLSSYGPDLAAALSESDLPIHWMIADDGSTQEEKERLESLVTAFSDQFTSTSLHFANAHRGKGSIIHEAWALAPEAEWLAFVDADGSVSAQDMLRLIDRAHLSGSSTLGIRKRTNETHIEESFMRSLSHHTFLLIARTILGIYSQDTQCGAKVIRGSDYRKIQKMLVEDGLAFDCELLAALQMHGLSWEEIPVTWAEKHGGKVKPIRDGWRMFLALLRIRKHLKAQISTP